LVTVGFAEANDPLGGSEIVEDAVREELGGKSTAPGMASAKSISG